MTEGIWADQARAMLRRYASSKRGHGGYPTADERYAIHQALDERKALLDALRELYSKVVVGTDAERCDALNRAWDLIYQVEVQP